MQFENELEVAKSIAREAGDIMRTYFRGNQQIVTKSDGSPLTIADTTINSMVIRRLTESFPGDIVIGEEESTGDYGAGRRWFCDPIDGTKAYTWGVPTAMFSLGLVVDGKAVLGVCYEPMLDDMYWAIGGTGAFRNGQSLRVNDVPLNKGIVGTTSSQSRIRHELSYIDRLVERGVDMAAFSGAVAMVVRISEGRFVGYVQELANAHDVAASSVILHEAGGTLTGLGGEELDYSRPFKGVIASNGRAHDELIGLLEGDS